MKNEEAREYIGKAADYFDGIVNTFSGEKYYAEMEQRYIKSRKICRVIKMAVFVVCIVIIFMHFWRI